MNNKIHRREFIKLLALLPLVKPKFELPEDEQEIEFVEQKERLLYEPTETYTIQFFGTNRIIFGGKVDAYNQIDITSSASSAYVDMLTTDSHGIEYAKGFITRGTSLVCGNQKVFLSSVGELSLITGEDCKVHIDVDFMEMAELVDL